MLDKGLAGLWGGYKDAKAEQAKQAKWQAYQDLQLEIMRNKNKVDGQQLVDYALSLGMPYEQITQWITPDKMYNWRLGKEWIDELKAQKVLASKEKIAEGAAKAKVKVAETNLKKPPTGRPETASAPKISKDVLKRLISGEGYDEDTPLGAILDDKPEAMQNILSGYETEFPAAIEAEGLTGRIEHSAPFEVLEEPGKFWGVNRSVKVMPGYRIVKQPDGTAVAVPTAQPTPAPTNVPPPSGPTMAPAPVVQPTRQPAPGPGRANPKDFRLR